LALPLVFCVWINLHGSWLIALAFWALYSQRARFLRKASSIRRFSRPALGRLLAVFVPSLAALFVNPYGWRLIWNPINICSIRISTSAVFRSAGRWIRGFYRQTLVGHSDDSPPNCLLAKLEDHEMASCSLPGAPSEIQRLPLLNTAMLRF